MARSLDHEKTSFDGGKREDFLDDDDYESRLNSSQTKIDLANISNLELDKILNADLELTKEKKKTLMINLKK